jgi:uncharacterized membrane protein
MNQTKEFKIIDWTFLVLSFIGFLDATYLAIEKLLGNSITCYIFEGCQTVNNSAYSQIFGIPLSFFGAIFYLAIFLCSIRYLQTKHKTIFKTIFYFSCFSALFGIYLSILQIFVIKALCIYCLISAACSVGLFITGFFAYEEVINKN